MSYFFWFFWAVALSTLFTALVRRLAFKFKILDYPNSAPRKIHPNPTPLIGGSAVFFAFCISMAVYLFAGEVDFNIIPLKFFLATAAGGALLIFGGILDDKYNLPPKLTWLFPALASLVVVVAGIGVGIKFLSNPFGAPINIDYFLQIGPAAGGWKLEISALLIWLWLMGMIYTTKFLDGLDGLTSGVGCIGAFAIFAVSLTEKVNQPMTATLAIMLAGALVGFLIYNFHPARIFLGEGGSTFIGFTLGVLAVILGAKIATALLVMGIPILDVAWVIIRRIFYRSSPFSGDRRHLHYRLLDIGFSQKQAVLTLYAISAFFGFTAVFLQSLGKLIALVLLFCLMIFMALATVIIYKREHPHIPDLFDGAKDGGLTSKSKSDKI